jgi:serine/threonine protein phosphatase PrpC
MRFLTVGAGVRGAAHKRTRQPCQDAHLIRHIRDSACVMAIADGHGSALCKYSDIGAKIAVEVFCNAATDIIGNFDNADSLYRYINQNKNDRIPKQICEKWKQEIKELHSISRKEEVFDAVFYGATLLGLILTPMFYFAFQLGDGDILTVDADGCTSRVIVSEKLLGTETLSLSSADAWKDAITHIRYTAEKTTYPAMFLLSTDGMCNSFAEDEDFLSIGADYLNIVSKYGIECVSDKLAQWLEETSDRGCGDDVTLVLAVQAALSKAGNTL